MSTWRDCRAFLQGLIQVCAGFHHFQNGNLIGALDLLRRGPDKMRKYPGRYMGIDAGGLLDKVEGARTQIELVHRGGGDRSKVVFPKIELPGGGA
jgi:predicted metal-dependent hydrolase